MWAMGYERAPHARLVQAKKVSASDRCDMLNRLMDSETR